MTVSIQEETGNIYAGGGDNRVDGDLYLRSENGQNRIHLDASRANIWVGGNGADGDMVFSPSDAEHGNLAQATIHLDGDRGDIILKNADCAEDFPVETLETAEPGTVMVIGERSKLRVSDLAYDKRVAGIVAGAGEYRPGIILGRNEGEPGSMPIALMGRVYCKVDADLEAIKIGDLLTTSSTPGHAMKASDPNRAFCAVIGKALGGIDAGKGMIPVLVTAR